MFATIQSYTISVEEYAFEPVMRRLLVIIAIFSALTYVYFVSASVVHIVARKDAETTLSRTATEVAELESQYFALSKDITRERAATLGLVPVEDTQFVNRIVRTAFVSPDAI